MSGLSLTDMLQSKDNLPSGDVGDDKDENVTTTESTTGKPLDLKTNQQSQAMEEELAKNHTEGDSNRGKPGMFTSHPTQNMKLGPWQFVKGNLKIDDADEADAFRDLIPTLDHITRRGIHEISMKSAEELISAHQSVTDRNNDSASGRAALEALQAKNPKAGTKKVGE